MEHVDEMELRTSKSRMLLFALLVLGGVVAGAWSLLRESEPDPRRVYAAIEGCSPRCAESVQEALRQRLREVGFELVPRRGEPVPGLGLGFGAAVDAAREAFAAHALGLRVVERRAAAANDPDGSAVLEVSLESVSLGAEANAVRTRLFAGRAPSPDETRLRAGLRGMDALVDAALADLLSSDAVRAYLETPPPTHEMVPFEALTEAARGQGPRERTTQRFAEACAAMDAEVSEDGGPLDVTCTTGPCRQETVLGLSRTGETLFVGDESAEPIVPLGDSANVRRAEPPDRVLLRRVGGTTPERTLLATGNVYGYGALSADTAAFAYVERVSSRSLLRVVGTGGGTPRTLLRSREIVGGAAPSPSGRYVAFRSQAHRRDVPKARLVEVPAVGAATAEPTHLTDYAGLLRWVELTPAGATTPEPLLAIQVLGEAEPGAGAGAETETETDTDTDTDTETVTDTETETATETDTDTETETETDTETATETDTETETATETDTETETETETDTGPGPGPDPDDELLELFDAPRVQPGAPALTHVALYRPGGAFLAHVGGVERPVSFVAGVRRDAAGAEELVLVSESRVHGCSLGFWSPATGGLRWVPLSRCIAFPALAGGRLFGEAALATPSATQAPAPGAESAAEDPSPDDAEIVEVDLSTGAVVALTRNAVRERYVRAHALPDGSVRLAFERIPRRRFRRFPQSSVCWADVPPVAP